MIGQTILHYEITNKLGSGGMGEVYLAVDSKLDRKVALKFLPPHLAPNGDVKARFMQEAKAASAMNHPNVCTIYDVLEHDGRMFIVMEHIDGTTLREKKGTLSISQVCEIGAQIADGLGAAHAKGIVHRDIKAENIMVRKDGIVQIMDFGLAKLRGVTRLTKEGSTIGTVGYMSPEQAQGQDVDHRTDIFSLGVVLFEMLTGELPFRGEHEAAIMYEIVNVDSPPPSALKPEIEPELDRIVLECLQKEPSERHQSALEVSKDLRRYKRDTGRKRLSRISTIQPASTTIAPRQETMPHVTVASTPVKQTQRSLLPWIVAVVAVVAAVAAFVFRPGQDANRSAIRFVIPAPDHEGLVMNGGGNLAISPDGRLIAFCTIDSMQEIYLWIRPVNSFEEQKLPGTAGAHYPFWSPDSRYLGFFTFNGKLKKVDVTGGPPINLCDAASGRGGTWNEDGTILFSASSVSNLLRVGSAGGVPTPVTTIDTVGQGLTHRWPWFLPDGNRFLYYVRVGGGGISSVDDTVWVGSLDGSINRPLMQCEGNSYFANGHLFYTRDKTLMAQPFDPNSLEMGDPFPVAQEVQIDDGFNIAAFTVSRNGTLVYITGDATVGTWFVEYNRDGTVIDTLGNLEQYGNCSLSPDGTRFAFDLFDRTSNNEDIWVLDLTRDVRTRLTFDAERDNSPVWSPDGKFIYFASRRGGQFDIYRKSSSGAGDATLVLETSSSKWPISCSSDGRTLLIYGLGERGIGDDLWSLSIDPETGQTTGELTVFQQTEFDEDDCHFSPDDRWIAYTSNETGEYEVYVRPFPGPGGKWQISNSGGDFSIWSRDGHELHYIAPDGSIMVVDVEGIGASFRAGEPHPLFSVPAITTNVPYDMTSDGQHFYVNCRGVTEGDNAINVVINWPAEFVGK